MEQTGVLYSGLQWEKGHGASDNALFYNDLGKIEMPSMDPETLQRLAIDSGQVFISGSSITMTTTILAVNKTSGSATTVYLPHSPLAFVQTYVVKDKRGDAATNNITIMPSSGVIDGQSSFKISTNGQSVSLIFDGTDWNIV